MTISGHPDTQGSNMHTPTIGLIGAFDTKAREYEFLKDCITRAGGAAVTIDIGVLGSAGLDADVTREEVAAAGGGDLAAMRETANRGESMQVMARGAGAIVAERVAAGELGALLAIGGSNAAYVMAEVSGHVPIGFPKMVVSTIAAGNTRAYIKDTDMTLMYPVVDINGLNRVSRPILENAAHASVGMAQRTAVDADDSSLVGISMFGVTTDCGAAVSQGLEAEGIESLTFHATGAGGSTLEALVRSGLLHAVADMTTTELADDLVGGVCTAGPDRLTAAGAMGVPQVVSVGALDMVNFWGRETIPERFSDRLFLEHNPTVTLMRTTAAELTEVGKRMAEKLNAATGPVVVLFPTEGLSQLSVPGAPFHDPEADAALLAALKSHLRSDIPLHEFTTHINDPQIAKAAIELITQWLKESQK